MTTRRGEHTTNMERDGGMAQLVVAVAFGSLAIVAVVLRIISRRLSRVYLQLNDYMIIFALVKQLRFFSTRPNAYFEQVSSISGIAAIIASVVNGGSGKHEDELSDAQVVAYWKTIFILIISWPITQTAIKISILLFYLQLFVTKQFSIAAYITMFVVCLWCIQQVLAALLICKPISYNWNFHNQTGTCGNTTANCIAGAAINVFTDLVILLLPMPTIWSLKIPTRSKLSLSFIFGLGFLICIVSCVRLRGLIFWSMKDGTYSNSMAVLWTSLESTLGIICACIVVMRPLFGKAFPDRLKLGEMTRKPSTDPSSSTGSRISRTTGWMRPHHHPRGLSGNGAHSHDRLGPTVFQRLEENIFALSPGAGQTKAANTTTIAVGTAGSADSGVIGVETQYPERSFIMVKKEWGVNSRAV
ncbi:hypothetical protein MMC29_005807 [Sticta canariensis]|nr:hypothetical protein [Sticta canariensis]